MKMIIEVFGDVISNILATEPCSIYIVDHDNLKERPDAIYELGNAQQPNGIVDEFDVEEIILKVIHEYKE